MSQVNDNAAVLCDRLLLILSRESTTFVGSIAQKDTQANMRALTRWLLATALPQPKTGAQPEAKEKQQHNPAIVSSTDKIRTDAGIHSRNATEK